jgi:organic hydroperoxide reductase OsmC/OhrA
VSATKHRAKIVWRGGKEDLRAHTIALADQTLLGSCSECWGGDPAKADPEELFVASLSACHMLWFLDFARRARLRVVSYEDEPEGTLDSMRFSEVVLRPQVAFDEAVSEEMVASLHAKAHEACFIANSVSCDVRVEPACAASADGLPASGQPYGE